MDIMYLSTENPPPQDRVGICLEGAPNARKPPPPWALFLEGGVSFTKITFWGILSKITQNPHT